MRDTVLTGRSPEETGKDESIPWRPLQCSAPFVRDTQANVRSQKRINRSPEQNQQYDPL